MTDDREIDSHQNPYAAPTTEITPPEPDWGEVDSGPFEPFKTIWLHPRKTLRQIVGRDPRLHFGLLVSLTGIGESLDRASMRNAGDQISLSAILGLAVVLGPLGGFLSVWIASYLLSVTGRWLGGTGNRSHLQAAIAWASVPAVVALPLWVPLVLVTGSDMFTEDTPTIDGNPVALAVFSGIALVQLVLGFWSLVLLCNTVAEAQRFGSAWKGLWNMIVALFTVLIPLFILFGLLIFFLRGT